MGVVDERRKQIAIATTVCVSAALLMCVAFALPRFNLFEGRPADHLSIHLLLELFAVIVSVMVVSIAWNTLSKNEPALAKLLVFGFTLVAGCDLLHALSYPGMPSLIVNSSTALAVFYWLSGRSIEVLTLCLIAMRVSLPGSQMTWLIAALGSLTGLFLLATHHLDQLPTLFVPGVGVTPFKANFEYVLVALNLFFAALLFLRSRSEKHPRSLWFGTACFIMGIGELAFTTYSSVSEFINVFGHLYKVVAYAFIYQATFLIGVREPYELLSRSERRIHAKGQELKRILRNLPAGIGRLDRNLRFRYVNPLLAQRLGRRQEDLVGLQIEQAMREKTLAQLQPHLQAALNGRPGDCELEFFASDGQPAYAYVSVVPDRSAEDNEDGVLAIFTDTTERELARRKLNDSIREISDLKAALDAHAIVAVTDSRGVITRVNDKFCSISQYPRSELIGQTHRLINSGHHPKQFFQDMWRTISRGKVWTGEVCNRAKDGSLYWVYTTIVPFIGNDGTPVQYIAIRADITQRKLAEQEARHMAFHDSLTGLPNRRLMNDRLKHAIACAAREQNFGSVLLIDLDHFKEINDTLGHVLGDELLRQAAERLLHCIRQSDTVARLGGDEFVLILEDLGTDLEAATAKTSDLGEKIRDSLAKPYTLLGHEVSATPSIGVVMFEYAEQNPEDLLKQADMALYKAKAGGRNQLYFFDPSLQAEINNRARLLRDLRQALEHGEFQLYYQPVVDARRSILGVEALIRWQQPERGMVSPAEFISLAEQSNLILPIGQWVLETACAQLAQWAEHPLRQSWTIAVNVSAKQFGEANFIEQVQQALRLTGARPDRLRLELTESMLHDNLHGTIDKMTALRQLGVRFSLDDFGTGYSSLSYLKRLPLDQLKIDKSFVDEVLTDANDAAIARTILALASILNLSVVAEGVETDEQLAFLTTHGCDAFQGYLFSRPLPASQLEANMQQLATSC